MFSKKVPGLNLSRGLSVWSWRVLSVLRVFSGYSGVLPLLSPEESWDRLQQIPVTLHRTKRVWIMGGWMDSDMRSE